MVLGFGQTPMGSSAVGYGTPSQANSSVAKLWIKEDGTQGNCAKIDPLTGDYVLDDEGNSIGEDSNKQMVYLALFTLKNTSSVNGFGLDLDTYNGTINSGTEMKVKLSVQKALKHMTDKKMITVTSIKTNRATSTGLKIEVQWKNNLDGSINEVTI